MRGVALSGTVQFCSEPVEKQLPCASLALPRPYISSPTRTLSPHLTSSSLLPAIPFYSHGGRLLHK